MGQWGAVGWDEQGLAVEAVSLVADGLVLGVVARQHGAMADIQLSVNVSSVSSQ